MKKTIRSDESQTARAGLLGSIAGLVSFLSGALLMPVISQILPADALGKAASFTSTREITFMILSLSIAQSVPLAMIDYERKKAGYMSSVFLFSGGCAAVAFLVSIPFKQYIIPFFYGSEFLFYWFFLMLLLQAAMEIIIFYINFHNRYIIGFVVVFLANTLPLIASVFFIQFLNTEKFISRVVGMDSHILLIGAVGAAVILILGKLHFSLEHVKYGLKISIPLVPYMVATIFLMRSDILVTSHFDGTTAAGIYTMAFTIANILFAVLQQLTKSWSPWVYRKMTLNDFETVRVNSKHFVLIAFLAGAGLMGVMPELVRFFISAEYNDCILLICPLITAMFFRFLNLLFYDVEYFHKKNMFNGISHLVAAIVNIVADMLLIRYFGFIVCAVTTTACYGLLSVVHYLYARHIEKRTVYNMKCVFICSAAIVAFCLLFTFIVDLWLIRYAVLLVTVAVAAFSEKNFIAEHVKKFLHR